ncbi:MAG: hypothetical protein CR993_06535 [Rhodobacterales bacterium]|nr:MAG: hypothetical protein CR993_06535 [Rhodobacterales bacterium]
MQSWILWMLAGVLSLVGGVLALANPFAATLAAEQLIGWMFLFVGMLTLVSAFADRGWGGRLLAILFGVVMLLLGVGLVANPLAGMLSLTYFAAMVMVVIGILRLVLAFQLGIASARWVLILSAVISLALGVMIFANWPQSATVVLGVFLAVELISNGISLIMLAWLRKQISDL